MIRLVRIEWRRMWSRRLPWILIILVAGVVMISGVISFATSSPDAPDASDFEDQIANDVAFCRQMSTSEWTNFADGTLESPDPGYADYLSQFESAEAYADENCNPDYFGYYVQDPRFCLVGLYEPKVQYRNGCPDLEGLEVQEYQEGRVTVDGVEYRTAQPMPTGSVPVTSLLLLGVAAVLGATFIGAEYSAGTIETTLLWETRRRRVLGAKMGVAAVSAALIHIGLLGFLVLVLMPSALWRGSTAGVDADFWWGLTGVILRGGVAAAIVAAIALSISTMTRNTVGGVVALLGYIAVSPAIGATLLRGFRPYDFTENIGVFANGGEVGRFVRMDGGYFGSVFSHGGIVASLIVLAYVAVAVAVAMAVFARRDID
jgi:ABC-type transport system involved in multi-copper enzyme maturation permease subunit